MTQTINNLAFGIQQAQHTASEDAARYNLNAVFIYIYGDKVRVEACDGYALSVREFTDSVFEGLSGSYALLREQFKIFNEVLKTKKAFFSKNAEGDLLYGDSVKIKTIENAMIANKRAFSELMNYLSHVESSKLPIDCTFNPELLQNLVKALTPQKMFSLQIVKMTQKEAQGPILVKVKTEINKNESIITHGLLMPCRD